MIYLRLFKIILNTNLNINIKYLIYTYPYLMKNLYMYFQHILLYKLN